MPGPGCGSLTECSRRRAQALPGCDFPVVIGEGKHLFSCRTQQLSPPPPMVLRGQLRGRVGRCRDYSSPGAGCAGPGRSFVHRLRRLPGRAGSAPRPLGERATGRGSPGCRGGRVTPTPFDHALAQKARGRFRSARRSLERVEATARGGLRTAYLTARSELLQLTGDGEAATSTARRVLRSSGAAPGYRARCHTVLGGDRGRAGRGGAQPEPVSARGGGRARRRRRGARRLDPPRHRRPPGGRSGRRRSPAAWSTSACTRLPSPPTRTCMSACTWPSPR